jgi:hypothetical protein
MLRSFRSEINVKAKIVYVYLNVQIPFGKFVFGSKGRIQDHQIRIPQDRIASFGIAAAKVDGPFALEVDYVGVEYDPAYDEEFAYETYSIPKFIAGV